MISIVCECVSVRRERRQHSKQARGCVYARHSSRRSTKKHGALPILTEDPGAALCSDSLDTLGEAARTLGDALGDALATAAVGLLAMSSALRLEPKEGVDSGVPPPATSSCACSSGSPSSFLS